MNAGWSASMVTVEMVAACEPSTLWPDCVPSWLWVRPAATPVATLVIVPFWGSPLRLPTSVRLWSPIQMPSVVGVRGQHGVAEHQRLRARTAQQRRARGPTDGQHEVRVGRGVHRLGEGHRDLDRLARARRCHASTRPRRSGSGVDVTSTKRIEREPSTLWPDCVPEPVGQTSGTSVLVPVNVIESSESSFQRAVPAR